MKNLLITFSFLLVIVFLGVTFCYAQGRQSMRDHPMKMDRSGRPMYNSWERQEVSRRLRAKKPLPRRFGANGQLLPPFGPPQTGKTDSPQAPVIPARDVTPSEPAIRAAGSSAIQNVPVSAIPAPVPVVVPVQVEQSAPESPKQ